MPAPALCTSTPSLAVVPAPPCPETVIVPAPEFPVDCNLPPAISTPKLKDPLASAPPNPMTLIGPSTEVTAQLVPTTTPKFESVPLPPVPVTEILAARLPVPVD